MDFSLTGEQREIQTLAREFAQAEIEPNAAAWDREHRFPVELYGKLGDLGLMGVCVPEELGGAGTDFLSYILVLEELSRGDAGVGVTVAVHTSACTLPILAFGTDEQRERFVPPLARGETLGAFALTEPESGSDAASLRTRADADDDGEGWTISGAKQWITNGTHAGTFLLFARTDQEHKGARGVSAFLLDAEHVRVTREEEKLGLNSSSTVDLVLEGAHVKRDRLLRRGRARLRGRDVDARRRPNRDRRAGARDRAGRLRRRARVREGAAHIREARSPSTRRSSGSSRTCRPRSTPPGCSSIAPPG